MELATITYIVVGLSFAVYIVIAIAARAGSTQEFYVESEKPDVVTRPS